ncbi:MAG: protein-glutamate O-methyltransferase CheR [Oscillospiraceae bacterium]|jgi:chemotaxis protein methyltransferase CheR|nr:protein-glutamate O-methyltransferase CheR [Oscillospiraceae bacterium]
MEKIKHDEFIRLVNYMRERYGINLEQKLSLVEGRLWNVINNKGFSSLNEYIECVVNDKSGEEAKMLVTRLTTNYTYFMREEQHYNFLRETILPQAEKLLRDRDLRIWSAGCSSGEEPYTTAMVIDEHFGLGKSGWDTKILATDISPVVLAQAREGVYGEERLDNVPPAWKTKYFRKVGPNRYKVSEAIQNEVIFRSFNLMETHLPFRRKFHVIFCRNVMIYFNQPTRDALLRRFYQILEPGGHLFIGLSETIPKGETLFDFVQPSIFMKPKQK